MKQYIKWFAKLLLLALILVIVDFGVGRLDNYVYKVDSVTQPDYLSQLVSCNDDIIIIGSSTASHHYIPQQIQDSIGLSVFNAGLDGAFFMFQNCAINYLLENNPPKYILWEIGEDCLSDNMPLSREYQKNPELYPYYDNGYIQKVIDGKDKWQRYRMMSSIYCDNSSMFHDIATFALSLLHDPQNKKITEDSNKGYIPLPNTGYNYPVIGCDSVGEFVNPEKVEMLNNTILACKNKGVKLLFVSSPRHYSGDILKLQQANKLMRIANEFGIPYLNFYDYNPISDNDAFFKDCDHLNAKGAETYMDVFIPALKEKLFSY